MRKLSFNYIHLLMIIYIIFIMLFSKIINNNIFSLIINPSFFIILTIILYRKSGNNHGRFSGVKENSKTLFIVTLLYLIFNFLSGLIFGYTKNIYSYEPYSLIENIFQYVLLLFFIEYTRSELINEEKNKLYIVIITIFYILLEIDYTTFYNNLSSLESSFKYISSTIIPIIFGNILYSYLSRKGSYKLVLVYRIPIALYTILSPLIPSHDWFLLGIKGVVVPTIIYLVMKRFSGYRDERTVNRKKVSLIGYIPFFIVIIIFVLFMAGVFKYKLVAILSNSMNPVFYRGDAVLYSKLNKKEAENIKTNTIIVYNKEGQVIVHRVIDRFYKDGEVKYYFKGDNNISRDFDPVSPDQIIGKYEFRIKYIGYPSVLLYELFKKEDAKVEIK